MCWRRRSKESPLHSFLPRASEGFEFTNFGPKKLVAGINSNLHKWKNVAVALESTSILMTRKKMVRGQSGRLKRLEEFEGSETDGMGCDGFCLPGIY